jgi:hypothetical protein
MKGPPAIRRSWRAARRGASLCACAAIVVASACYSTGNGTAPPGNQMYYPVGLAVSAGGNVLYVANSDFDLQYNGGTVQSYDLKAIRNDTVRLLLGIYTDAPPFDAGALDAAAIDPEAGAPNPGGTDAGPLPFTARTDAGCPFTQLYPPPTNPNDPGGWNNEPGRLPIGQACAPPMNSEAYFKDDVVIGAFATTAQFSNFAVPPQPPNASDRLFVPVRGDATLTWMDVVDDVAYDNYDKKHPNGPNPGDNIDTYPPFHLGCNRDSTGRCDVIHHAGQLTDPGNTRQLTLPGEPFAMAVSDDGTAIAVTHQAEGDTSLFLSGVDQPAPNFATSLQFYVDNLPLGGDGIVAIPHDQALPNLSPGNPNPLRPAFLQTSNLSAEIDLLRYYSDEGYQSLLPVDGGGAGLADAGLAIRVGSSNLRPFLVKERAYNAAIEPNDTNSRGIAIDPTPRIACEQGVLAAGGTVESPDYVTCAETPSRVFIASRSPASLLIGSIGAFSEEGGVYDPDALTLYESKSLSAGPSNVYVAPIVDATGHYSVRVFVVCFDSQTIAIYNPETDIVENVVETGPGPFGMAFDPFSWVDVATHAAVPFDARMPYTILSSTNPSLNGQKALRTYRFGYVTSFTDSYVQVMDLDQSFQDDRLFGVSAFETMVYSLGLPIQPVQAN